MFAVDPILQMNDEAERDERDWEEACRREDAIRTLLTGRTSTLTAKEVEAVAVELGLSRATLYRMIRRYRDGYGFVVTAPLHRSAEEIAVARTGMRGADRRIPIREFYLKPEKPKFGRL